MRSSAHNDYYWLVLRILERHINITAEKLHELFKHIRGLETTTRMNTEEFSIYVESIIDAGVNIFKIDAKEFDEPEDKGTQLRKRNRK